LIYYVDTSALVALFTTEAGTAAMLGWYQRQAADSIAISGWSITEFSSALSQKARTGYLDASGQSLALAAFRQATQSSFHVLGVHHDDFIRAAIFANQHTSGLRAGEALHLSICFGAALKLLTFDKRLAAAAQSVGVSVEDALTP
jgi:uncharacterized protein